MNTLPALGAGLLARLRRAAFAAWLASIPILSFAASLGPDAGGYSATDATVFSFVDIAGPGGGASVLAGTDDGTAALSLPFSFSFYGQTRSLICVSSNGAVYFISNLAECAGVGDFANTDLSSTAPPGDLPALLPFWTDLTFDAPGADAVSYQTLGVTGSRRFVIQWNKAFPLGSANPVTFQVILTEGTNKVVFQYKTVALGLGNPATGGGQATVGIRDTNGQTSSRQIQWSFNAPVLTNDSALAFTDIAVAKPTVSTPVSSLISTSGATLGGSVTSDGGVTITERGVVLSATGTNADPLIGGTSVAKLTATGTTGTFNVSFTGLTAGTGYSFKAYALNSEGVGYTSVATFSTLFNPPTVTTGVASSVTQAGGVLNGTFNPNGTTATPTFEYGLTTSYTNQVGATQGPLSGSVPIDASATLTGLTCGTLYHYRLTANSAGGTTNGLDATFTTLACSGGPPTVTTLAATSITQTGATLNGSVNPNDVATDRRFQYGLTNAYGTTGLNLAVGSGNAPVAVSETVTGLACNTLYHFRAVGQSGAGTTEGSDLTFTTAACPVAGSNNIAALTARSISINSISRDSMSNVRAEVWYRVRLSAARSYQFSAWPVDHEQGTDAPGLSLAAFSDDAGVAPATPVPTLSTAELEGSMNSNGDARPAAMLFQPATSGVYKIRVLRSSGGTAAHTVNVAVRETTLFSPWTSRAAGFEGFIEMHNNTNAAISVTLRAYNNAGALQGAGLTFSIPANATVFKTATEVGVPVNVFAGVVLTHNGAFGAVSGNITTLNGANGLSFDSPFTPRDGGHQAPPIR